LGRKGGALIKYCVSRRVDVGINGYWNPSKRLLLKVHFDFKKIKPFQSSAGRLANHDQQLAANLPAHHHLIMLKYTYRDIGQK
jgi:hypothetical protein